MSVTASFFSHPFFSIIPDSSLPSISTLFSIWLNTLGEPTIDYAIHRTMISNKPIKLSKWFLFRICGSPEKGFWGGLNGWKEV